MRFIGSYDDPNIGLACVVYDVEHNKFLAGRLFSQMDDLYNYHVGVEGGNLHQLMEDVFWPEKVFPVIKVCSLKDYLQEVLDSTLDESSFTNQMGETLVFDNTRVKQGLRDWINRLK